MTPLKILGIDPGYDRCGIAVMEKNAQNGTLLHSECIETDRTLPLFDRLLTVGQRIEELIDMHQPHMVGLERLYFNNNQKTAMGVAEVRGMVVYLARRKGCRVAEYTPQEVKIAVTGYGKSTKAQVALMLARLIPHIPKGVRDDEEDAIAIALTTLVSVRTQ